MLTVELLPKVFYSLPTDFPTEFFLKYSSPGFFKTLQSPFAIIVYQIISFTI